MKNDKDNWNPQHYKKNSQGQYARGISILQEVIFKGDENILDIGCGDGRITAQLSKQVPVGYILGVDVSINMINEAKKSFGDIKNIEFQCIDAATFLSDKKFDLAFSNSAFHWIKDQNGALKNIYKHLKLSGKLIIKMAATLDGPIPQTYKMPKWFNFFINKQETFFPQTAENFAKMLKDAGFENIKTETKIASRPFNDKDELFNWAFSWVPHSTGLPEDKAREFTYDIVENVCNARKDGQVILESALLDVSASKFIDE